MQVRSAVNAATPSCLLAPASSGCGSGMGRTGLLMTLEALHAAGLAERHPVPGRNRDRRHSFPHPKQVRTASLPCADLTRQGRHLLTELVKVGLCWPDLSSRQSLALWDHDLVQGVSSTRTAALWVVWQQASTTCASYSCAHCSQSWSAPASMNETTAVRSSLGRLSVIQ